MKEKNICPNCEQPLQEGTSECPNCTARLNVDIQSIMKYPSIPGYKILNDIGEGGMGKVYLAKDEHLGRRVAIKMISDKVENIEEASARFLREAKAMAMVEHPNIVRIYTYGKSGDKAYFVMEYIEGDSLYDRIKKKGKLSVEEVLGILKQVIIALDEAWEKKIIHRDIKPSNILIDKKNQVKLADFGLAKPIKIDVESTLTSSRVFQGTPHYISPEQIKGDPVDFRVDIYSLGITLYEMLVGERPYNGTTPMVIISKHLQESLPSIKEKRPDIPDEIQTLIEWMTQKDPTMRPSSSAEIMTFINTFTNNQRTPAVSKTPQPPINKYSKLLFWTAGVLVFFIIAWIFSKLFLLNKKEILPVDREEKRFVVAVAPFYGPDENSRREGRVMAALVEKSIVKELKKENIKIIGIEETREIVHSHEEARALGEKLQATVLIWGESFAVRGETEIQPYFTMVPIKKKAEKEQAETGFISSDEFKDSYTNLQDKSAETVLMGAEAPDQIKLRKIKAKGIGDMVFLLVGIHALNRENNAEKALALLKQAPEFSESLRYMAYALLKLGKKNRALTVLKKSVLLDPKDAESFAFMGDLYMKDGKFQEAVKAYKAASQSGNTYTSKRAIFYNNKLYSREVIRSKYIKYNYKRDEIETRYLLESDPLTGTVTNRYCLPGIAKSFMIKNNSIHITYDGGTSSRSPLEGNITFSNGKFNRPVFYGENLALRLRSMRSGDGLAVNFMEELKNRKKFPTAKFTLNTHKISDGAPSNLTELENSLRKAIIKDPTQPWHLFFLGQTLWVKGQNQEAKKTWDDMFSLEFPHIPYYEFAWMAYYFERLEQFDWADRAYNEALKRRRELPQPIEFSFLLDRIINAMIIRQAAILSKKGKDMNRAYLWLNRARKLMGICSEDYFASLFWKTYFLEQGDMEKAARENAILKRTNAHPINELKACAYSDYSYHLLIGASIGFFLVWVLLMAKAARQDIHTDTQNHKILKVIKRSYLYQIIAKGSLTFKIVLKSLPVFTALPGIIILFLNDEKYMYYITIIFFFLFIYIFMISKKCTTRSFIASISRAERRVLGISLLFVIITSIFVLSTDKDYYAIYGVPLGICDSWGHSKSVHDMENLLKEKDTGAIRYAAAVMNHMAGNISRAAELYKSLPRDRRARRNLEELKKNNPVPPVPLLSEEIFFAYDDSVSWKKIFTDLFEELESYILFAQIIFILNTVALLSSLLLFLGFLFIPAENKKNSLPSMSKFLGWFSRISFFLVPGTFDIRHGSKFRGWLVITLFAFAVSSIWGFLFYGYHAYSPGMISAYDAVVVYLDYNFPLPHSLSDGKNFMEFFRWEIFWNWPGAKIFWGAVILCAIISLILHITRFRKIRRSCK
jgi:serine/threonine protein kinase/Flp pilus assembly protein TadD